MNMPRHMTTAATWLRVALTGAACAAAVARVSAAETEAHTLEEIVVTAQKREESLQDVPVSVAVIDGAAINQLQLVTGSDVPRMAPNLQVSMLGNEEQPKFAMRGIATTEFNLNAASSTGVFYDEVYVSSSYLGGPQLYDMERIEVLRGPQGTLFGKNNTGGAINFITRAPTFDTGGYFTGSVGRDGEDNGFYHATGAFEMPLVEEKLAMRLAVNYSKTDPWFENENSARDDLSSSDVTSGRLTFAYRGENDLEALLRIFTSRSDPKAVGVKAVGLNPGGTNVIGVNPRVSPITGRRYEDREGFFDRAADIKVDADGTYLTINKALGAYTLTSITSYVEGSFANLVEGDATGANLLHLDFFSDAKEMGQDLRLASDLDGPFNYVVGLHFFRDDIDIRTQYHIFEGVPRAVLPPGDPLAFVPSFIKQTYNQERTSYAAYFNGGYDLTDKLTLNVGLRWTHDKGELNDFLVLGAFDNTENAVIPFIPLVSRTYKDEEPSGKIGLEYRVTDELMVYGHYTRGYRSSAFNGGALNGPSEVTIADPEFVNAYEVGFKSQLAGDRLQLNGSAFYYDFQDQQFIDVVTITDQRLVNAGKSEIMGVELDLRVLLGERVAVSGGIGLLNAEYKELVLGGRDLSGNDLIEAPDFSGTLAIDYTLPLQGGSSVIFHVDGHYVDDKYYSADNAPESRSRAYTDTNARVAWRSGSDKLEVALWGKNLSDNTVAAGIIRDATTVSVFNVMPPPRRFGIEATYNF